MNERLNAKADFKDINISLFRHFPNLSVSISGVSVIGVDTFRSDTLFTAKNLDVSLDLMQAVHGSYDILNIAVNSPHIHALVLEDGRSNWQILRPAPPSPAGVPGNKQSPVAIKLRKYSLENAYLDYEDRRNQTHILIRNLNHQGHGDFTEDIFTLSTQTSVAALTIAKGSLPYLTDIKTTLNLDLLMDTRAHKYTLKTGEIQLNNLKLTVNGFAQGTDTKQLFIDIKFNTPSNDFKDFLSIVPGVYQDNFKDIKATGILALNGRIKGITGRKETPGYNINLSIGNGTFQYPGLPGHANDIQLKLALDNPDGIPDHAVLNLPRCHFMLDKQPVDLALLLKTPVSDPWIDATVHGRIDLNRIQQFIKTDAGTHIAGNITADVAIKGSVAAAQKRQYDKIDASGTIRLSEFSYSSKDHPDPMNLNNLILDFTPKNVTLSDVKGNYLGTFFSGEGYVDNLLSYALHDEPLTGYFSLVADKVDLNKLIQKPSGAAHTEGAAKTAGKKTEGTVFLVPANLDITLNASVGEVKFDQLTMNDFKSKLVIRNELINLEKVTGNALDGSVKIDGYYSTHSDKKNPDIQLDYVLTNVDIQQTYNSFGMMQKLLPAAKYLSGRITSNLLVSGKMGPGMAPVMSSLTGKGDLLTHKCVLSGYPVTDRLGDLLNLPQLKSFDLADRKFTFTFENGRVFVEPFKMKIGDIDADVSGSHGFDQTMDYTANMLIPRAMMGQGANKLLHDLVAKANNKGWPVKLGDKVNLIVKITGTTTNPKYETNLRNLAADALKPVKTELERRVDSMKHVVNDTLKSIKKQLLNQAKKEIIRRLSGEDELKNDGDTSVGDRVKNSLRGLFKKKK